MQCGGITEVGPRLQTAQWRSKRPHPAAAYTCTQGSTCADQAGQAGGAAEDMVPSVTPGATPGLAFSWRTHASDTSNGSMGSMLMHADAGDAQMLFQLLRSTSNHLQPTQSCPAARRHVDRPGTQPIQTGGLRGLRGGCVMGCLSLCPPRAAWGCGHWGVFGLSSTSLVPTLTLHSRRVQMTPERAGLARLLARADQISLDHPP